MNRRGALGQAGEDAAADFLTRAGLDIVTRNWRCARGEIDIVAREGLTIVFVEVKTRSSLVAGHPLEAITPSKLARLRLLAAEWCRLHRPHATHVRIDAVGVLMCQGAPLVDHVPGITL